MSRFGEADRMLFGVKSESVALEDYLAHTRRHTLKFIDGEVIPTSPAIFQHTLVIERTRDLLKPVLTEQHVYAGTTYVIPDTTRPMRIIGARVPDVMVVSSAVLKAFQAVSGWQTLPLIGIPEMAVEVVAPDDAYSGVVRDVNAYLKDGVKLVWVLDLMQKAMVVYQPTEHAHILKGNDIVNGGDVLPGFSAPVGAFFTTDDE